MQYLLNYDVDLAVIIAPPKHPDVFDLAVVNQPLFAVMDAAHPLSTKGSLRLSDCLQYPLILPSVGLTTREMLDTALQPLGRIAKIAAETNSYEVMRGLLPGTEQVGFVLSTALHYSRNTQSLIYHPLNAREIKSVPIICAQLRSRGLSVAAAQFSQLVMREMENIQLEEGLSN
jgi:DNA-binding transcriptional LysR family regulator